MPKSPASKRICPVCDDPFEGRSDKKFCSAYCKSTHQYQTRHEREVPLFKTIDEQLKRNRRILKKYNLGGFSRLKKGLIEGDGFNPSYFTHQYKTKGGNVYYFCYEYGFRYVPAEQKYLLIRWQEYMEAGH